MIGRGVKSRYDVYVASVVTDSFNLFDYDLGIMIPGSHYEKDVKNYPNAKKIDEDGINLVNQFTISGIPKQDNISVMVSFNIEVDGTPTITAEILDGNDNVVKADSLSIDRGRNIY